MSVSPVTVLGAGLAGCEAAWQCAERGVRVRLVEMKPIIGSSSASFSSLFRCFKILLNLESDCI